MAWQSLKKLFPCDKPKKHNSRELEYLALIDTLAVVRTCPCFFIMSKIGVATVFYAYLDDYKNRFDGRTCTLTTNYEKIKNVEIEFNILDLHHLFKLGELTKKHASLTIPEALEGKFRLEDYINHPKYEEVKKRVEAYKILEHIFYTHSVDICIEGGQAPRSSMKVNVLFYEKASPRTAYVLGLREVKPGKYKPVTLHQASSQKYDKCRTTIITGVHWN